MIRVDDRQQMYFGQNIRAVTKLQFCQISEFVGCQALPVKLESIFFFHSFLVIAMCCACFWMCVLCVCMCVRLLV